MKFEVKVLRGSQGIKLLSLDAKSAIDAETQVRASGYSVISTKAKHDWLAFRFSPKTKFPLLLFSQEMVTLLQAGLSLVEVLETIAEKEDRPELKKIMEKIITHVKEGHKFSYALEQLPEFFPSLYVATVRSSEMTGTLAEVLARYISYQSQMEEIRKKIITSSIYPVLLAVVGSLVVLFLMLFVVPSFSHIYEDMGGELPYMSRLLMKWGQFIDVYSKQLLALIVAVISGLVVAAFRPESRIWIKQQMWKLPTIGERLHMYQMARFYRSLGMLLQGGMSILVALKMLEGLIQESERGNLKFAALSIQEGGSISQAMDRFGLSTPLALRLLRVGERTGQMGEMMEHIATFYEEETVRWIERFVKLFEPLLMLCVGMLVGLIVVLMYFPIFELAGSIK